MQTYPPSIHGRSSRQYDRHTEGGEVEVVVDLVLPHGQNTAWIAVPSFTKSFHLATASTCRVHMFFCDYLCFFLLLGFHYWFSSVEVHRDAKVASSKSFGSLSSRQRLHDVGGPGPDRLVGERDLDLTQALVPVCIEHTHNGRVANFKQEQDPSIIIATIANTSLANDNFDDRRASTTWQKLQSNEVLGNELRF